ncbi:MAG TPA: SGNH/GDSL hydrolase family protein [Luteolibacter sp.]|nr:SGNH/GDSL hydrolase family protein [Luteolibacter sp.]
MEVCLRLVLLAVSLCLIAMGAKAEENPTGQDPIKVLFIGNSLTFYNDLPAMVEYLAGHAPSPRTIEVDSVTVPGVTLEKHWLKGVAQKKIQEGGWDYVVLQGQSLEAITQPESFFHNVRLFDAEIRKSGAKTLLYMTWALRKTPEQQAGLTAAYRRIGKELGARVIPVGVAREILLKRHADAPFYLPDGKHPSPHGSYLAACLFHAALTGQSPKGLPALVPKAGNEQKLLASLTPEEALEYQGIAEEVLKAEVAQ